MKDTDQRFEQSHGCRLNRQQRGQTLLEFALVAPLLIFFILALVDFGIAIDRRLVLDHAVREGARFASVGSNSITGERDVEAVKVYVAAQSQGLANAAAADGVNGSISVCEDGAGGVQVGIDYTYQLITPIAAIANLAPGFSIPLLAKASARVEQALSGVVGDCENIG